MNTTFITSYYHFENGINKKDYFESGKRTLSIQQKMIIYVGDNEIEKMVYDFRKEKGLEQFTKVIIISLEELLFYTYKEKIKCETIILLSKFMFVLDTLEQNYFNTNYFSWIDFSLLSRKPWNSDQYTNDLVYEKINKIAEFPRHKFTITILSFWDPSIYDNLREFYQRYQYICSGGFTTMDLQTGKKIMNAIIQYAKITLESYGHGDENLYGHMIDLYRKDFNLNLGDYQDMIDNYYKLTTNHNYVYKIYQNSPQIYICVYACPTIDYYKQEILDIEESWGKDPRIKVLYFFGEEQTEFIGDRFIYLKGISNDYLSASYKQNLGLKYVYERFDPKFVYCCGTDTYIFIDRLLEYIKKLNYNDMLYIGGDGDYRYVSNKHLYYHSGGPGFILSNQLLSKLYPKLENMVEEWAKICPEYLRVACDVCISYYIQEWIDEKEIVKENELFYACDYNGMVNYRNGNTIICCGEKIDKNKIIACHYMHDLKKYCIKEL